MVSANTNSVCSRASSEDAILWPQRAKGGETNIWTTFLLFELLIDFLEVTKDQALLFLLLGSIHILDSNAVPLAWAESANVVVLEETYNFLLDMGCNGPPF